MSYNKRVQKPWPQLAGEGDEHCHEPKTVSARNKPTFNLKTQLCFQPNQSSHCTASINTTASSKPKETRVKQPPTAANLPPTVQPFLKPNDSSAAYPDPAAFLPLCSSNSSSTRTMSLQRSISTSSAAVIHQQLASQILQQQVSAVAPWAPTSQAKHSSCTVTSIIESQSSFMAQLHLGSN